MDVPGRWRNFVTERSLPNQNKNKHDNFRETIKQFREIIVKDGRRKEHQFGLKVRQRKELYFWFREVMRQQLNGKKELKLSGGVVVECHSEVEVQI